MKSNYSGLIAAVFTPMQRNGSLNLEQVPSIVEHLVQDRVDGLYVCGSTGEGPSLSSEERCATAKAYVEAARGKLPVIIQIGHNSLVEARKLAVHARTIGADAVAAVPPSYFEISSVETLVACLAEITSAAPDLPFFYYHIPSLTGADFDMVEFLRQGGERMENLAGIKYSSPAVDELQACVELGDRRFTVLFGCDEMLLSGLCVGVNGAVGSTFNFAAPLYRRIIIAFEQGDMKQARKYQALSVEMVRTFYRYRSQPGFKGVMKLIGLDCGPNRLPLETLRPEELEAMKKELDAIGFFDWARTPIRNED